MVNKVWFLWLEVHWLRAEHDVVFLTYQNSFRLQLEKNTLTSLKRMRCDQSMRTSLRFSNSCGKSLCSMLCTVYWEDLRNFCTVLLIRCEKFNPWRIIKKNKCSWGGVWAWNDVTVICWMSATLFSLLESRFKWKMHKAKTMNSFDYRWQ